MRGLGSYIGWIRNLPREIRGDILRYETEIQLYRLWSRLRGRRFDRPVSERASRERGKCYYVTKSIPDISVFLFGRYYRLLKSVELEMIELACPGEVGISKTFLCEQECRHCGREIKVTDKDKPVI